MEIEELQKKLKAAEDKEKTTDVGFWFTAGNAFNFVATGNTNLALVCGLMTGVYGTAKLFKLAGVDISEKAKKTLSPRLWFVADSGGAVLANLGINIGAIGISVANLAVTIPQGDKAAAATAGLVLGAHSLFFISNGIILSNTPMGRAFLERHDHIRQNINRINTPFLDAVGETAFSAVALIRQGIQGVHNPMAFAVSACLYSAAGIGGIVAGFIGGRELRKPEKEQRNIKSAEYAMAIASGCMAIANIPNWNVMAACALYVLAYRDLGLMDDARWYRAQMRKALAGQAGPRALNLHR